MKDIYSALAIDPKASDDDIAASAELKSQLRDAAAILLDSSKRAKYDSSYTTLKTIGELRHRLGLDSSESWFVEQYPDFIPKRRAVAMSGPSDESAEIKSPPHENQAAKQPAGANFPPKTRARRLAYAVLAILLVIVLVLMITLL